MVLVKVNGITVRALIDSGAGSSYASAKLIDMLHLKPCEVKITRKSWLKILGVTFQENPTMWDLQMNELMSRACSRLYIIRTCKYYGFSSKELDLLFHSLINTSFWYRGLGMCVVF